MPLTLQLVNETTLPDGGPVSYHITGKRGIDIGRDSHLDWTLPDPTRYISGKHCEIRYRDGNYWLHDVSTNGTFLNGSEFRMQAPHRLRNGDRFTIGPYLVAATVEGEDENATAAQAADVAAPAAANYQALWDDIGQPAPPLDRAQLRTPRERARPVRPDFLDWAADVPTAAYQEPSPQHEPPKPIVDREMDWASGAAPKAPPPPEPSPAMPNPRRPGGMADGSGAAWIPPEVSLPTAQRPADIDKAAPAVRPAPSEHAQSDAGFAERFALGARLPKGFFSGRDSGALAEELGALTRLVAEDIMQLLKARLQAKQIARSSRHTVVQPADNNPLKLAPNVEEALRIMLGPPTASYLDARRAMEQAFGDIKLHQIQTFSAMQNALRTLLADLDPQTIEKEAGHASGLASALGSRKAKLWETFVTRWQAKSRGEQDGLLNAFMLYFAEYYDRSVSDLQRRK